MSPTFRRTISIFVAGAVTSFLALIVGLSARLGINGALSSMSDQGAFYGASALQSGITWVVVGFFLHRAGRPTGIVGWVVRIGVVIFVLAVVGQALSLGIRSMTGDLPMYVVERLMTVQAWFGFLAVFPFNVIAIARASLLVWLAAQNNAASAFSPPVSSADTSHGVTRILCGNAVLGGSAFRRSVLDFFREKWTAVAPEFGVDIELLTSVCNQVTRRERRYTWLYAGLGVIGLLLAAASTGVGLLFLAVAAGTVRYRKWRADLTLAQLFRASAFDREAVAARFADAADPEVVNSIPRPDQNVIVYRGFSPFVGAGLDLGGWSFVTFLDRKKPDFRPQEITPFTVEELNHELRLALEVMGLPGLQVRNYHFVRGLDVRLKPDILGDLSNRPKQRLSEEYRAKYMEPDISIRDYICIQVYSWSDELVVTYFVRCALQTKLLMVEVKRFLLPPLDNSLRRVDRLLPDRLGLRIVQMILSAVIGPISAVLGIIAAFIQAQEVIVKSIVTILNSEEAKARRRLRVAEDDLSFDYGAATSLRARFAQREFQHYFQKADADFGNKAIERKILDEIERFLDDHGIDTADLRERQTSILNNGVIVHGGDVRAESLAVGEGARAFKTESRPQSRSKEPVT